MGHVLVDTKFLPERPISGTVRYMSSENAARKLKLKGFMVPFTRLVHLLVAPLNYIVRPYQRVIWNWDRKTIRDPNTPWSTRHA